MSDGLPVKFCLGGTYELGIRNYSRLYLSPQPNALCAEVLHQLRTEQRMEVTSAQTVDDTLVYLLVDQSGKKTAQIGCRLLPEP